MRELFTDSIRAGLANIDLHDLKEPAPDAKAPELIFKDSVKWTVLPDRLLFKSGGIIGQVYRRRN